jgi:hypothetical protein
VRRKVETRGSASVRHTHPNYQYGRLPSRGARHAPSRHARATRPGGDERQESVPAVYEAQTRQVQGQQKAEQQALSGRDVSGRGLRTIRRTGTNGRAADLPSGGMFANQPLRIRLRLPRYWRRHQTLPGAGNLFGRWRLRVGQLWIRLHLRQSRGSPVRLRLDGGVSRCEVHRKQRLRIRLPLHQSRNQCRPVCLARTSGVAARAPARVQCPPGSLPGGRFRLRILSVSRRAWPLWHRT